LYDALGAINIYGNFISAVGANLQIARTAGEIWRMNSNAANGYLSPNITSQTQASPQIFRYQWQSATPGIFTVGSFTTNVDPDNWDDGTGTLQPVSGGSFTIQRLYIAGSATNTSVYITYGQTEYATANDALAGIITENPNIDPAFKYLVLKAFLIVKEGSTDLADGVNQIIPNSGLGGAGGGGGPGFSGISGFSGYSGSGGNIGNVTFDNVTIQGVNGLNLSAGADFTANLAYLQVRAGDVASHIHMDTGNNAAYDMILGDDSKFIQVSSIGNIIMSSYDSGNNTSYAMTLDTTGNLTLAGNTLAINFANGTAAFTNLVQWTTAPVANTSTGTAGAAAYDSGGNLYICVATDTWAKFTGTTSW